MRRIAVLTGNIGTGTNLQALIDQATTGFNGQIVCVVSSRPDAPALERARRADLPAIAFDFAAYRQAGKPRSRYEEDLARELQRYSPDLIVCAGWNLVLSANFLRYFAWRVIAIHPGLLSGRQGERVKLPDGSLADPYTGLSGANAIQALLASGQTYAGSTVHVVTADVDWGPVLEHGIVKVEPDDTIETLYARLKEKEHQILLAALRAICVAEPAAV